MQAAVTWPIPGDVYRVQRRPSHNHIAVNDDYEGVRIIDPRTGDSLLQTHFTAGYDDSGIIDAWCFRADGKAVLVINEEGGTASWLSLEEGGQSYDLAPPPFRTMADLRYFWDSKSFWITSGKTTGFYKLVWEEGQPVFAEARGMESRLANRSWREAIDLLPMYECNVLRVEPDFAQMLFHDFSHNPGHIGVVNWTRASEHLHNQSIRAGNFWSAPTSGEVPMLAFHEEQMYVLHEYEVCSVTRNGEVVMRYPVPEGCHYVGLDTIPADDKKPAGLVLFSSLLSDPWQTNASLYVI